MTIYYSVVFMLLLFEGVVFPLVAFLPGAYRGKVVKFLIKNPVVQGGVYWVKIVLVFVFLLFLDSTSRVWRVSQELGTLSENKTSAALLATDRCEIQSRRFYAQRNMYLTGFTLYLSFVLAVVMKVVEYYQTTLDEGEAAKTQLAADRKELAGREAKLGDKIKHLEAEPVMVGGSSTQAEEEARHRKAY